MINVAIIDDEINVRDSIERFISQQAGFQCVLAMDSVGAFFEAFHKVYRIHILLLDVLLHEQNSIEHITNIKKVLPDTKIIMLTKHRDPEFARNAILQGVHGYCIKNNEHNNIIEVINITLRGGFYLDPFVLAELIKILLSEALLSLKNTFIFNPLWELSQREEQIAEGLLIGKAYKEIARAYHISIDTVRHHVKNLYKKLNVHSKKQLLKKLHERA